MRYLTPSRTLTPLAQHGSLVRNCAFSTLSAWRRPDGVGWQTRPAALANSKPPLLANPATTIAATTPAIVGSTIPLPVFHDHTYAGFVRMWYTMLCDGKCALCAGRR